MSSPDSPTTDPNGASSFRQLIAMTIGASLFIALGEVLPLLIVLALGLTG